MFSVFPGAKYQLLGTSHSITFYLRQSATEDCMASSHGLTLSLEGLWKVKERLNLHSPLPILYQLDEVCGNSAGKQSVAWTSWLTWLMEASSWQALPSPVSGEKHILGILRWSYLFFSVRDGRKGSRLVHGQSSLRNWWMSSYVPYVTGSTDPTPYPTLHLGIPEESWWHYTDVGYGIESGTVLAPTLPWGSWCVWPFFWCSKKMKLSIEG